MKPARRGGQQAAGCRRERRRQPRRRSPAPGAQPCDPLAAGPGSAQRPHMPGSDPRAAVASTKQQGGSGRKATCMPGDPGHTENSTLPQTAHQTAPTTGGHGQLRVARLPPPLDHRHQNLSVHGCIECSGTANMSMARASLCPPPHTAPPQRRHPGSPYILPPASPPTSFALYASFYTLCNNSCHPETRAA